MRELKAWHNENKSNKITMFYNADINECATGNGGCGQTCVNAAGSFHCACLNGYTLNADGKSCTRKNATMLMSQYTITNN